MDTPRRSTCPKPQTLATLQRWGLVLCAGLLLLATLGVVCQPLACRGVSGEGDGDGDIFKPVFTLDKPLSLQGMGGTVLRSVDFELADGASQGGSGWYVVDLAIQADFGSSAAVGSRNYISVATNGRTAAQIEFTADRVGLEPTVRWSTYELFTGPAEGIVFGESVTLRFRNYMQIAGVRPGVNRLELQLEQPAGVVVSSVRLLKGSGVSVGVLGPPHVTLDVSPSRIRAHVGDALSLRYVLANEGFPARDVGLVASVSARGVAATESPSRFLGWVAGRDEGTMSFLAVVPGEYTLTVEARGATGGAAASTVDVVVDAR